MNFLHDLEIQGQREGLIEGLSLAVRMHYLEYTDQTELYGPFAAALETIMEHVGYTGTYVEDLVSKAEYEINQEGGIRSATDGKRHKVVTYKDAYAELLAEEE